MSVEPEYLTPKEIAAKYRFTRGNVVRWCRENKLTAYQPGGFRSGWRILVVDWLEYFKQNLARNGHSENPLFLSGPKQKRRENGAQRTPGRSRQVAAGKRVAGVLG